MAAHGTAPGRVLHALFCHGEMSRADLTRQTNLSNSTVGTALAELSRWGVLDIGAPNEYIRGRPSPHVHVLPERLFGVVIDVGTHTITHAIIRLDGRLHDVVSTPLATVATPDAVEALAEIINTRITGNGGQCVGVGLSLPGIVNPKKGIATLVLPLDWERFPVVEKLRAFVDADVPIRIAQDALVAARAEFTWGGGSDLHRMLYLLARDTGVGGAIVGVDATEGVNHPLQAGHIQVRAEGSRCSCGAVACLETFTSGDAIHTVLTELGIDEDDLADGVARLREQDLQETFAATVVGPLQTGLTTLVNALGPDGVVLGGELVTLAKHFFSELDDAVSRTVVARVHEVPLRQGGLDYPILMGCGLLAFEALLDDPRSCGVHRTNT